MSVAVCPAGHPSSMAPTAKAAILGSSSERIRAVPLAKADDTECSDSAASSSDHLPPVSSSSPGASCNGAANLTWHDDGDTTDDQDDAGWQLVAAKSSSRPSTVSTVVSSKAAVCGRCGMRGHQSARCRQPFCSRCNKWWHTEEECGRACHVCGSLDHKTSANTTMCKSYKCRECGLYGHVYAECPNIVCNLCKQVGHKALDCPSIVCNLCKQQGHKAINCPNPRGVSSSTGGAAGGSTSTSKPAGVGEMQQLQLVAPVPAQLRQSGSSCGSNASPRACASASASVAATPTAADACAAAGGLVQLEVPLIMPLQRPANSAELQLQQQQHSQLLSSLYKAAPDVAVALLDSSSKLQALLMIEPQYLARLVQSLPQHPPSSQQALLESAVVSAQRQLERQQQAAHHNQQPLQQAQQAWQQPLQIASAASHHEHPSQLRSSLSNSSTPASPATPSSSASSDLSDATQGIKPGDLAPQHAKQLVAEFGDMLPSRWQQLPSWRQLEARLSFPDGNYVQRRLQFREKRRQLQLLTLQLRAAAAAAKQQQTVGRAAGSAARLAGSKGVRVVAQTPAASAVPAAAPQTAARPAGPAPSSYAAALAGPSRPGAPAAGGSAGSSVHDTSSSGSALEPSHGCHMQGPAAGGSAVAAAAAGSAPGIAVCRRCGMLGHAATSCVQPRCSRCHLWWHTEAQCSSACQFCGSLDHQGDAEQPSSCQSFKCKACKMFGHTASTCPHVQLHQQQEQAKQQAQQLLQQHGVCASPVAASLSAAATNSSLSSSSSSTTTYQLTLQAPALPLSKGSGYAGSSSTLDSPLRPPDSPGLGQQGVKPKDLLPEHARALQEEFPNALPPGWQQMASWRMVEERLRVVAVEGAVFSKRRQMWRDRRKHYQALTAQALAAAAHSAACDAAAAAAAAGELAPPTSGTLESAASASTVDAIGTGLEDDTNSQDHTLQQHEGQNVVRREQEPQGNCTCDSPMQHPHGQDSHVEEQQQQPHQPQQTTEHGQEQGYGQPDGSSAQQYEQQQDHLVPEWQQQQGSLFGLAAVSSGLQQDSSVGQAGSSYSCDTASFCCSSPLPAVTPSVLLSPLDADGLGYSGGSTPIAASGTSSCVNTPAVLAGAAGMPPSRHPSGPLQHMPLAVPAGVSSPMPSLQATTPVPTPRSAAAAAAAAAAAMAAAGGNMGPPTNGVGPYATGAMGMLPGDSGAGYSPVHYHANAGVMPRSPLGYSMAPPASPIGHNAAAAAAAAAALAAGRAGPPGMMGAAGSPALYQQMLIAQRQSQLQQQLLMQSPYGPRVPASEAPPASQQMLLNMQMQQQAQSAQQQARMHQQRRMDQAFLVHQAQQRHQQALGQALGQAEEFGEGGELDDKLGVLGVLGLQ